MELFSYDIPLWALIIGVILLAVVAWKLIKFAIKVLITVVILLALMIGLDIIGVFSWIQENILSSFYG
jgi:hypothetical protein